MLFRAAFFLSPSGVRLTPWLCLFVFTLEWRDFPLHEHTPIMGRPAPVGPGLFLVVGYCTCTAVTTCGTRVLVAVGKHLGTVGRAGGVSAVSVSLN